MEPRDPPGRPPARPRFVPAGEAKNIDHENSKQGGEQVHVGRAPQPEGDQAAAGRLEGGGGGEEGGN